jgi:isopenicillin N synthase-like dioxygenase
VSTSLEKMGPLLYHFRHLEARMKKFLALIFFVSIAMAEELSLKVIPYDLFMQEDAETLETLRTALYQEGIVGIRGVPGYTEKLREFIDEARAFSALPEETKEQYAPNREKGDLFLGYEKGKEKFKRPDGKWVVDDLKVSYYAFVPESPKNRWPLESELQKGYIELGSLMAAMGKAIMEKIDLIGPATGIFLGDTPQVGRMLYYQKSGDTCQDNPYWCGAHFDHGLFTVITPASYFMGGTQVSEPEEAGLFVNVQGVFKKVAADPEVMMFQVAEFGQLVTNDAIRATEHRVQKAKGAVERYAMALFFEAPSETTIHSQSTLTLDARYGGVAGAPCSYKRWSEESFKRYIVE